MLRGPLRTRDATLMRPALMRWVKVVLVWQVAVVAVSAAYMAVLTSQHSRGFASVAPPLGAVFGSALPLQVVVIAILRAGRGS